MREYKGKLDKKNNVSIDNELDSISEGHFLRRQKSIVLKNQNT